jgi:PIN domain nuclease of toxin-antitoxin system
VGRIEVIVMDTCAIIWDAIDPAKISAKAKKAINKADENNALFICDISLWEIAMLITRKRVEIDETPANFLRLVLSSKNYTVVSISPEIAELSVTLASEINNDPADRIIVASAMLKQAPLVTADNNLRRAKIVETIW